MQSSQEHFNISALAMRELYRQIRVDLFKRDNLSLNRHAESIFLNNLSVVMDSRRLGFEATVPRPLAKGFQVVLNFLEKDRPDTALMIVTNLSHKLKCRYEAHSAIDVGPARDFLQPFLIKLCSSEAVLPHLRARGFSELFSNAGFNDENPDHLTMLQSALHLLSSRNEVPRLLTSEEPAFCVSLINTAASAVRESEDETQIPAYQEAYAAAVEGWAFTLMRMPASRALIHVNEAELRFATPELEGIRQRVAARHVNETRTAVSSPA